LTRTITNTNSQTVRAIKSTIAEIFGGVAHSLAKKKHQFDIEKNVPDLSGKVAVITGGLEGIGLYCRLYAAQEQSLKALCHIDGSEGHGQRPERH
jgi:hypothetical protein